MEPWFSDNNYICNKRVSMQTDKRYFKLKIAPKPQIFLTSVLILDIYTKLDE